MKIDDRNAVNLNLADVARARSAEAVQQDGRTGQTVQQPGGREGDRVALSELSAKMGELASGSPERRARIAALAAEFAAGRYEPDAGAVADALIAEAELGGGDEGF